MNTKGFAILLVFGLGTGLARAAEDSVWKCIDPETPFRFVSAEDQKDNPPPCGRWLEIRGPGVRAIFEAFARGDLQRDSNFFLSEAGDLASFEYPSNLGGAPIRTSELYRNPTLYGFTVTDQADAPPGSLVLYNGLGGILVEAREPSGNAWSKKVLYPSASIGQLRVSDLATPAEAPKILVLAK
jgi:hypothetical protein